MKALTDGHPLLIMQNVGLGFAPVWHFAVVIGFHRADDVFILRTGAHRRQEMSSVKFERRWRLADYWAVVLLAPDDFPVWLEQRQYEEQLALMERQWQSRMSRIYHRMLSRWPESSMAMLGLGNSAYSGGDLQTAAAYYERIISTNEAPVAALNNLAQVRFELGEQSSAIRLVCRALRLSKAHPLAPVIANTADQFRRAGLPVSCTASAFGNEPDRR